MVAIKLRINSHIKELTNLYAARKFDGDDIIFWERQQQPSFEAVTCVDSALLYAANKLDREVVGLIVEKDGYGVRCSREDTVTVYHEGWEKIDSLCINDSSLFVSHKKGISKVGLQTKEHILVVDMPNEPCILTSFGPDVLFTNQERFSVWCLRQCGELEIFAGTEEGSVDGPAESCRFKQPLGICTEFDSVVYVCDVQTSSIKLFTHMSSCASFLSAVGSLYEAFSVHTKGNSYTVKSLSEAHDLVQFCSNILHENELEIRSAENITGVLNGPQGHVSAKTVSSVRLIKESIKRLGDILGEHNYRSCNLLSCMTLDIENCHVLLEGAIEFY